MVPLPPAQKSFLALLLMHHTSPPNKQNSSTLLCPGSISKLPEPHRFQVSDWKLIGFYSDSQERNSSATHQYGFPWGRISIGGSDRCLETKEEGPSLAHLDTSPGSDKQAGPSYFLSLPDHRSRSRSGTVSVCVQDATHSLLGL